MDVVDGEKERDDFGSLRFRLPEKMMRHQCAAYPNRATPQSSQRPG